MPISSLIEARSLSPQTLADMALLADREARKAKARGDETNYLLHDQECTELCELIQQKGI